MCRSRSLRPDDDAAAAAEYFLKLRRHRATSIDLDGRDLIRTDHAVDVVGAEPVHVAPVEVRGANAAT